MSLIFMGNKGMVTLEAVVLIIVVALGLLAMQRYLQRSIQAHWRTNADTFYDEQYDLDPARTTENFIDTHPRITGQPQITLSLNPNPSIAGNYSSNTHIGAFRKNSGSLESRVMDPDAANAPGKPAIFSVHDWQAECEGEGCGEEDEE